MKKLLALSLLLCASAFADTQQNGFMITTTSPAQFSATLGYVQRLVIRAVPGYCGKIYIGTSTMNTSTLAGVIKVIYPNCTGGLSDEYSIQDVTGANGIDSSQFYIQGQNYGDTYLWESYKSTVTPAKFLQLVGIPGPCNSCAIVGSLSATSVIQVNVVPGQSGKINVSGFGYVLKQLYPNNGVVTGNITDKWELYAVNPNGITGWYAAFPDVAGEFPLVAVWSHI